MTATTPVAFDPASCLLGSALLSIVAQRQGKKALSRAGQRGNLLRDRLLAASDDLATLKTPQDWAAAWQAYLQDATARAILTSDILRQRGDITLAHDAAGAPPVLIYDHEVILEGRDLERPSNYVLLKIVPPDDVTVFDWKRPYVIIDPRAGHGPGIGGFKHDSQVGVAMQDGHPVYFVAFHQYPEPGQTIADVTHSEAAFLEEVQRRHPDSPKPIVVGNCQGGWATAILAACYPALTGPIVLNGAPMSYWGGKLGQDPMRYGGGLSGGVVPALLSADLNGGLFDGAHLVQNFESLNPGRTWFRKYADLYAQPEATQKRFLDFERWWGGFYLMTREEIRWIVENLFIGNRLAKNEAFLEPGRLIDLKRITAPIIVFASHGDNITPPAQALNWIIDTYTDETEIAVHGQRILYMLHEEVGHLGIFVSSSIARREHSQMASTLKTIEALPPGLYEMMIEDHQGVGHEKSFTVSFSKRTMAELDAQTGGRRDEAAFAGVARASESAAEVYETALAPLVQAMVPKQARSAGIAAHPLRLQRTLWSSRNPWLAGLSAAAGQVAAQRTPAGSDNPFLACERLGLDLIEQAWDMVRDLREVVQETSFFTLWSNPWALWYGAPLNHARTQLTPKALRALPEVQGALARIETGGIAEACVRALILLAESRDEVRRDRLVRSSAVLSRWAPFDKMAVDRRAALIHEQGLICRFAPEEALMTLPSLVRTDAEGQRVMAILRYILGAPEEMEATTARLLAHIEKDLIDKHPTDKRPTDKRPPEKRPIEKRPDTTTGSGAREAAE